MKVITSAHELQRLISDFKQGGKSIGFVPTMGALHEGHLSLLRRCRVENDVCVASIFVNPTQFNSKQDLNNYPRTLETDIKLLESVACDVLFAPSEEEIYCEDEQKKVFPYNFDGLDSVMEGKFRPAHFNGVVQIVSKLFSLLAPNRAYFGEKDFQQVAIIRQMVQKMNFDVEIVACPIKREKSGLAMSSRNELLTADERKKAANISKILNESLIFVAQMSPAELSEKVTQQINAIDGLQAEYFDIVDGNTLQEINDWYSHDCIYGCIAVFCGKVRLIDNIMYKNCHCSH